MLKILERNMDVGKFRTQVEGKVQGVAIKGLRARYHKLRQMDEEEFKSRISMTPEGEIRNDHIIRGTPSAWFQKGTLVYIWPFPVHQWSIKVESEVRDG